MNTSNNTGLRAVFGRNRVRRSGTTHRAGCVTSTICGCAGRWATSDSGWGRVRMNTPEPTVLLLSTSDTDLITARASGANYRWANPSRLLGHDLDGELAALLDGADVAVVRIRRLPPWQDGIDAVLASGCRPWWSAGNRPPTPT